MTLIIKLPPDQEATLNAKAKAEGLSAEQCAGQLLGQILKKPIDAIPGSLQAAANIVLEEMSKVPPEIMAVMPKDGASQHDHYLYGWPKKEA